MTALQSRVERSPILLRALPFVVFVAPIYLQDRFGVTAPFWVYAARTFLGAGLVCWMIPRVREMRWAFSLEAVLAGVAVFVLWVGLHPWVPTLGKVLTAVGLGALAPGGGSEDGWNPFRIWGEGSFLAWSFVIIRLAGSSLVVPPLEEVFYRSFLYRLVVRQDFEAVSMRQFDPRAFIGVSVIFGLAHQEWLAGILCGALYQGLVLRRGRLGDAMVAHAITNFLLGLWVIGRDAWHFW
jgi:hypothetical protein